MNNQANHNGWLLCFTMLSTNSACMQEKNILHRIGTVDIVRDTTRYCNLSLLKIRYV